MLRVQTEAFQAANGALGQMRAAALPAPSASDMQPVGSQAPVGASVDDGGEGIGATPPHLQQDNMHNVARKLRVKDGGSSMAVSKDSLYTVQDGVGAPRIAAAPAQARERGEHGGGRRGRTRCTQSAARSSARCLSYLWLPLPPPPSFTEPQGYNRYSEQSAGGYY